MGNSTTLDRLLSVEATERVGDAGDLFRAPEVWDLTTEMSQHDSPVMRYRVIRAIAALGDVDKDRAARLLAGMEFGTDEGLADEVLGVVAENGLPLDAFGDAELDQWLHWLEALDNIDKYWIREFIGAAAIRRPAEAARLLIARCEAAPDRGPEFRPLPYDEQLPDLGSLAGVDSHRELLREVRDQILSPTRRMSSWHCVHLFAALSAGFGPTSLAVLDEWVRSGDSDRIAGAARLLKESGWEFVFAQEEFIERIIDAARAAGAECEARVVQHLLSLATTGLFQGTPGEPAPRHVQQRDRAAAAAARHADGSPTRRYYLAVRDNAIEQIDSERIRDAEEFGL